MDWEALLNGFDFHDQLVLNHQIDAIGVIQASRLVNDRQPYLVREPDSLAGELQSEAANVG